MSVSASLALALGFLCSFPDFCGGIFNSSVFSLLYFFASTLAAAGSLESVENPCTVRACGDLQKQSLRTHHRSPIRTVSSGDPGPADLVGVLHVEHRAGPAGPLQAPPRMSQPHLFLHIALPGAAWRPPPKPWAGLSKDPSHSGTFWEGIPVRTCSTSPSQFCHKSFYSTVSKSREGKGSLRNATPCKAKLTVG